MYLINTKLSINWTLYSKVSPPILEDMVVSIYYPDNTIGIKLPILSDNYIRPTINTLGYITYEFTPVTKGLHRIELYISGVLIGTQKILVMVNDTNTKKFVSSDLL